MAACTTGRTTMSSKGTLSGASIKAETARGMPETIDVAPRRGAAASVPVAAFGVRRGSVCSVMGSRAPRDRSNDRPGRWNSPIRLSD